MVLPMVLRTALSVICRMLRKVTNTPIVNNIRRIFFSGSPSSGTSLPEVSWQDIQKGKLIGSGISASVYRSILSPTSGGPPVQVAVKVPEREESAVREAKVLLKLDGAGGAPCLVGLTKEAPRSLVMEWITGVTFVDLIESG